MDKSEIKAIFEQLQYHLDSLKSILLSDEKTESISNIQRSPTLNMDDLVLSNGIKITAEDWPLAVPEESIVRTSVQELTRAKMMASKLPSLTGKILDFGCGKGYLTEHLHNSNKDIIGYDKKSYSDEWVSKSCKDFYTSWEDVVANGPFDSVIMYDVIDHIVDEPIQDVISKIKESMSKNGVLYVFAHPWTGPHGGHLYEHINKAYAHLLINKDILDQLYPDRMKCVEFLRPQAHYKVHLEDQFKVKEKKAFNQPPNSWIVENIVPILKDEVFNNKVEQDQLIKIISLAGIYYQLVNN